MSPAERDRFDALVEQVLDALPRRVVDLLAEAPLIVEDAPSPDLLEDLGLGPEDEDLLCGLHTGTPLTERTVDEAREDVEMIHLFRLGVIEQAGGWAPWEGDDGSRHGGEDEIRRQIRITVLHEIGHHFGLEETDLEELGYG
ncbi:MAG: metallopeptidase family protein [Planctomycetota bacterium]|jgi:predicted Zn-dependent protease with MMP-like domain